MDEQSFRYRLLHRETRTTENQAFIAKAHLVGNFYDVIGPLIKAHFVDRDLTLEVLAGNIASAWDMLAPMEAIKRRLHGVGGRDNFEYLAVLSQDWLQAHPVGTYPKGVRRLEVTDKWIELDANMSPQPV